MMLSRLVLDSHSREVRACLRDAHRLHRLVMRGFPHVADEAAREAHGVLHRLDHDPNTHRDVLLVQSRTAADWGPLASELLSTPAGDNPSVRSLDAELEGIGEGAVYMFRLRANVTRKIDTRSGPDGAKRNGRRVPLRDHDACVAWLERKGAASGFALVRGVTEAPEVRITDEGIERGRDDGRALTFEGCRFDGLLRVTDAAALREAVRRGVGPARAFGFGLLSLRRV